MPGTGEEQIFLRISYLNLQDHFEYPVFKIRFPRSSPKKQGTDFGLYQPPVLIPFYSFNWETLFPASGIHFRFGHILSVI
jgi:hypothetical protein